MHDQYQPLATMAPQDVPVRVIWYEDATAAARALGVDVELPDLGITDRDYWARFDRKAWRNALRGRVAMSDEDLDRGDVDWVRLAEFPAEGDPRQPIELWFDLEDGIVFRSTAGHLGEVVALIQAAAARGGLSLSEEWPGCVTAMQSVAGAGVPPQEQVRPLIEAAGFRWRHPSWYLTLARSIQ